MRSFLATLAATAVLASASAAAAAVIPVTLTGPAADGSLSGAFMVTGIASGAFTDTFTFTLPSNGITGATVTSIATANTNNVSFGTVTLDGTSTFSVGSTGTVEFQFLNPVGTNGGSHSITVNGTSGGDGAFSGTIAFSPAGVPEPASWALMIAGLGAVGASLRSRRRSATVLA